MISRREHPSDHTLLRWVDRELSARRRRAVDVHLARCAPCAARLRQMRTTADDATRTCRDATSANVIAEIALRARLQLAMDELTAGWNKSRWHRARRALVAVPIVIRAAACVAAAIVALQILRPAARPSPGVAIATVTPDARPIAAITPGVADIVESSALCAGRSSRPLVNARVRQAVLRDYAMEHVPDQQYELDFLITPELGGSADRKNLWPQRYDAGLWNARVKDDLEQLLPDLVCRGAIDLRTAQRDIAGDWIAAYRKYFKTERPLPRRLAVFDDDDGPQALALLMLKRVR